MSHRIERDWTERMARAVPFGLGHTKPHHYREMLGVLWENRDNLGYAWKVLTEGVCDGCALGTSGLSDWTIDGVHLCMTRLKLLRLNTMPAMDPDRLADVGALRDLSGQELRDLGRLAHPMVREAGEAGFRRVSWDEALGRVASAIGETDPDRVAFYLTSRGLTNEVYYVAQKVARWLGTPHVDNAARLCHSPSTAGLKDTLGVGATTCSYTDWFEADLVCFFGANPANDQPVTTKFLEKAKRGGTEVALVNPYREPGMERYWIPSSPVSAVFGTDLADHWFPVRQGGDVAFIYGVIKTMLGEGWVDEAFTDGHTEGLEELRTRCEDLSWEELEEGAGLDREAMREMAGLLRDAETAVLVWSMGITQHAFGSDGVRMICNLGLTGGFVGREGCGLMPIRGHSGVQGGAEMGAYATVFPGGRPVNEDEAARLADIWGFEPPPERGWTAPEMVEAAERGDLDVLYSVGGNFIRTLPEPERVAAALGEIPLRVHQDIICNEVMLRDGGEAVVLLPARTRYEQAGGGTETTTERRVIFSPEIPREVGEARSEWRILRDLAVAVDPAADGDLGCATGETIREEIARVIPFYDGIQDLREAGDQFQYGGPHLCAGWAFPTDDGKARFRTPPLPPVDADEGTFLVSTRRGKQFNSHVWGETDPITGAAREAVLMNPDDAGELGLRRGDRIDLMNETGRFEGRVHPAPIARGNLQIHWPEGNVVVPGGRVDEGGGVPDYNATVRIEVIGP